MTFAIIAYITLLATYKLWLIRFLENIYRSPIYSHDSFMEILIGLSMIEFAFLHYVYTRVCWLQSPFLAPGGYPQKPTESFETQGNENIPSQPSYQNQDEPQTRREPESTHCECCFFNWVKRDSELASERTRSANIEDSLDSSSTWAVAIHVSSLGLDGDTLVNDGLVELGTAEYLEDPGTDIHL
ncbi:hypothetical protein N7481_007802 [Penicillium waksmanii]|uniref:uncharacterized protein n=1 Tax=Penicillium waksmanii TaxID=69791 RepID=UPI002547A123|nr:uncharacterized protein N7481_007802 [Penicillium waksmanii]KAJ5980504.1 hypothetical protein N7481_007802 [Penicillium waksmanii]